MQTVDQCRWSHLDHVAQPHVFSNRGGLPSLHLMIELRQFGRSAAISTEWHWLARYWPGKLWASKERGGGDIRQTDTLPLMPFVKLRSYGFLHPWAARRGRGEHSFRRLTGRQARHLKHLHFPTHQASSTHVHPHHFLSSGCKRIQFKESKPHFNVLQALGFCNETRMCLCRLQKWQKP